MTGAQAYTVLQEASLKNVAHKALTSVGPGKHYKNAKRWDTDADYLENEIKTNNPPNADYLRDNIKHQRQFAKEERRVGNLQTAGLGLAATGAIAYAVHKARQKAAKKREEEAAKSK